MVLQLRDYQKEGRDFLRNIRRGFLADDPGLGKSFQATEAAELPGMIICPRHLIGQWQEHLETQYDGATITVADGSRAQRETALSKQADWTVISLQMQHSYKMPTGIKTYIYDESHRLRNRNTTQARAAYSLVGKDESKRVYFLSASPMWKSVDDIWMQLHILYPTVFSSYHHFVDTFCVTSRGQAVKVLGIKRAMRGPLRQLLNPVMLRRTQKDVGRELPPVIENIVWLKFNDAQKRAYDSLRTNYKLTYETEEGRAQLIFSPVGMLHTLRAATMFAGKTEAIKELVEDNQKQTLVFMWYKDHAKEVQKAIPNSVLITGEVDAHDRHRIISNAKQRGQHIVATQASLTEGVNLQTFRQVIFGETHYSPESNRQALARVVRDRNDDGVDMEPILVHHVMVRRTIDDTIYTVANKRGGSISDVVDMVMR